MKSFRHLFASTPLRFVFLSLSRRVSPTRSTECEGTLWEGPARTSPQGDAHAERAKRHHTDFSISITRPHAQPVKVPCGSNISGLINDAKMKSLLDDHCKYRTH